MYLLTVVGGRFISYLPDLTMWTDLVHLGRIALVNETFGDVFINWLKIIIKLNMTHCMDPTPLVCGSARPQGR